MNDHIDGLRLMLLVIAVLLRINGLVFIYLKRKHIWTGPALVLDLFSPILALITVSIVASKNYPELKRTSTIWPAIILIGAFLLSQFFAGASFVGAIFVMGLVIPVGRALGPGASVSGFSPLFLLTVLSLYSIVLLSILRTIDPKLDMKKLIHGKRMLSTTAIIYLLLLPMMGVVWLFGVLLENSGLSPATNPFMEFDGIFEGAVVFIAIVVLAPLVEETFFRGHLFKLFEEKLGGNPAVVLTAILFALMHFSLVMFLPILIMGFMMGWARKRTGSIIPSLVFHFVNNLTAFFLVAFGSG
ncbi:MAG: type II CAAX endopeptidase family protein [Candidatus Thermoplasmatota archaeon]|nr:type II CAAX endopeptidase family protein [Candidatus Thermoplasmatota archaeon]